MSATSRVHAWWIQLVAVTSCCHVKSCKHLPRVVIRGARRVSLTWPLLLQAEDKLQQCRHVVLCRWFPRLSCCRTFDCFPPFSIVFRPSLSLACSFWFVVPQPVPALGSPLRLLSYALQFMFDEILPNSYSSARFGIMPW